MPLDDSSFSNCSLLTKSRRTGSCRSCRQSMRTAPRMWFLSYAAVSSSTSTSTTFGSSRCASTQSASTSTLLLGICLLLCLYRFSSGDVTNDGPPEHTDQSKMDLATEAEVERRVEERGGQGESRRHDPERRDAGEIADRAHHREAEADTLREPRRCLGLEFVRGSEPRRDKTLVEQPVRREPQAGEGADAEHNRLGGEQPAAGRDQNSGENDGGDGRAETRTPRVDVHKAELLGKTGRWQRLHQEGRHRQVATRHRSTARRLHSLVSTQEPYGMVVASATEDALLRTACNKSEAPERGGVRPGPRV